MRRSAAGCPSRGVHHGEGEETIADRRGRPRPRRFIAGDAGDQRGAGDAVTIQFVRPRLAASFSGSSGGSVPSQLLAGGFDGQPRLLRRQRSEESGARRNGRARRRPPVDPKAIPVPVIGDGHGRAPGSCVRPVDSASCVRPATLFTPSFFIMVLR